MAERRMFSLAVVDTDAFLDLPASAQSLYFHMGLRADDDGFVAAPKRITAMTGCSPDDLKLLIAKGFLLAFDSGVCVVRDWHLSNTIKKDRYHETRYLTEKAALRLTEGKQYEFVEPVWSQIGTNPEPVWNQVVSNPEPQTRLDKTSQGKKSLGSGADKPPARSKKFVPPTVEEVAEYCRGRGSTVEPATFVSYYVSRGWMVGNTKMRDWKAAVRTWESRSNAKGAMTDGNTGTSHGAEAPKLQAASDGWFGGDV